jgi:hypothetical protein
VGTLIVFLVLRADYPRLAAEIGPLLISAGLFTVLTAAAGASFYGVLKGRGWRRYAVAALVAMLGIVALYHGWPLFEGG